MQRNRIPFKEMFIKPEIYTTKRCLKINITIKISLLLNLS